MALPGLNSLFNFHEKYKKSLWVYRFMIFSESMIETIVS